MSWTPFILGDYAIHAGDGTISLYCLTCHESVDHDEPQQWPDGIPAPMTVVLDCVGETITIATVGALALHHHKTHHRGADITLSAAASIIKIGGDK